MKLPFAKKQAYAVFAALIGCVLGYAALGDNGLLDLLKFRKERDKIQAQKESLEKENAALSVEIELLKKDKRYIALTAREQLGMIGKTEVLYKRPEERK